MNIAASAEKLLRAKLSPTATPTKYIAGFQLPNGLQVALERNRQGIYLWSACSEEVSPELARYRTRYSSEKSRNSNLNQKNASMLREGRPVDYWILPTLSDLEKLLTELASN